MPALQETPVQFLGWEDLLEKGQATHQAFLGFPGSSEGKESARNVGDLSSIPGGGNGGLLQYSCLENPMDRGAWRTIVHGVRKSTLLSD